MGRGKIEIKRIENSSNRQVTYTKRRNGLMKKASEITILCDAQVSLVIFGGATGKMAEYHSPSTSLIDILDKYHQESGKRLWDAKHENLSNEIDRIKKENDSMQIELRHMKGEDLTSLNYKDLMALENALENGLNGVREKQSEFMKMVRDNGKMLEEENKRLSYELYQKEMAGMGENVREMENGYQQRMREFNELPFSFRVQPIQPNLQERI